MFCALLLHGGDRVLPARLVAVVGQDDAGAPPGELDGGALQFSREYRRRFGAPPSLDAARVREAPPRNAPAVKGGVRHSCLGLIDIGNGYEVLRNELEARMLSHDEREYREFEHDEDLLIIEEEHVAGPYRDGRPIL